MLLVALPVRLAAQSEWLFFGGPQYDEATYRPPKNTDKQDRTSAYTLSFGQGSGMGWHAGAAYRAGSEKLKFRGGLTLTMNEVSVAYTESSRSSGLGGGGTWVNKGHLDDRFALLEAPLLISIRAGGSVRFETGFSPWWLMSAHSHDSGERNSSWWNMLPASGTYQGTYDRSADVTSKFVPYGVMFSLGFSGTIKKHFLVGTSSTFSLPRTYESDSKYSVGRFMARLSVGYVLVKD
ncbi:MAG: hypothetical protein JNM62_09700 [Flavobacteriales bacterium]|nr:hypothetical protein [Flavobacteriales bacterium]